MPLKNPEARRQYQKNWYKKNRARMIRKMKIFAQSPAGKLSKWKSGLKYKFGITYADYLKLWREQEGNCALCGKPLPKNTHAHVDHDHKTQRVRGLVHLRCNLVIGVFEKWGSLISIYLARYL